MSDSAAAVAEAPPEATVAPTKAPVANAATDRAATAKSLFPNSQDPAKPAKDKIVANTATPDKSEPEPKAGDVAEDEDSGTAPEVEGKETKPEESGQKDTPEEKSKAEPKEGDELRLNPPKDSPLSKAQVEQIASFAKEHKLDQKAAQLLLDNQHKAMAEAKAGVLESQKAELKGKRSEWLKEAESDAEIGGKGFAENAVLAERAVTRFASPTLRKMLGDSGLGNHPELIRTFARIGRAMADDKFIHPGAPPGKVRSVAETLYPKHGKSNQQQE